ncbi:MAG: YchJ family protein [Verrucomicrobia bacterium]|jgi:SEC-C motif domain protein|nr:YchJ family protein [Verrucomicrobiota bacterium]
MNCPCGSEIAYNDCCAPIIKGKTLAPTAEALMRSRYTAYALGEIEHLGNTLDSRGRETFDAESARQWAESAVWKGLEIVSVERGGAEDDGGVVEFIANYEVDEELLAHHERATFRKSGERWEFVDGRVIGRDPYRREEPKVGRNDPCPCGSGKKLKKCCG